MIKRLLATMTVIGGLAYALHIVHWRGWHRGWVHALDLISWDNEYTPDYGELPY